MSDAGVPTVLLSPRDVASESAGARAALLAVALGFLTLFLVLPLAIVFSPKENSRASAASSDVPRLS